MSTCEEVAVVVGFVVMVMVAALVDVEGVVRSVAAAEFVLPRGREGHVVVRVMVMVVVEHEVANGFPGDLATFHHHVEI